jgi:hypothetical protein
MNRRSILGISAMTTLALALLPSSSIAQQKSLKEQIIGTWVIVSSDSTAPDGSKLQVFGPDPKGILVFDASGQTVQIIVNPGGPKFKINNRLTGTPEENTAACTEPPLRSAHLRWMSRARRSPCAMWVACSRDRRDGHQTRSHQRDC